MEKQMMRTLQEWYEIGDHTKIISYLEALPAEEMNDDLWGQLARAYNNNEEYEKALAVLEKVSKEGRIEATWHYRRGYAYFYLDQEELAITSFFKAAEYDPTDPDAWLFLEWAYADLEQYDLAEEAAAHRYVLCHDKDALLLEEMSMYLKIEHSVMDGCVFFPQWQLVLQPQIAELNDHSAILYFYLQCPQWDRTLFECAAGMGNSSPKAMNMAIRSFLYGIMDGIFHLLDNDWFDELESSFAEKTHRWRVASSKLVAIGAPVHEESPCDYWSLIKDEVAKRIGNQKLCYIKIYGANHIDGSIGECRINDIEIPALSRIIAEEVDKWEEEEFTSHKQFFFLLQDEDTYEPYPYRMEQIEEMVQKAVAIFQQQLPGEPLEQLVEQITREIGDSNLAEELYCFLPELCAAHEFDQIDYGETLLLLRGETPMTVYKTQLASYYAIEQALFRGFEQSWWPQDVYSAYISVSAIYSAVQKAKEDGADLEKNAGKMTLSCQMSKDYQMR